jgi:outer membrane protein TolC
MTTKINILILFFILNCLRINAQGDSLKISLDQCIETAINYSPTIKEGINESVISELGMRSAQSGFYPSISSQISGGFSNEFDINNNYKTANANVSADQVLWQNGKVHSLSEKARYAQKASETTLEARKQELIFSVTVVYFTCLEQAQLYESALENVSTAELFLKYARERYAIGSGRKSDVLKAESDLAEAEYERNAFLNALRKAQNELVRYTGLPANRLSNLQEAYSEAYNKQVDSLYNLALNNYPELQTIYNIKFSQQAKINEARADMYPQLSVSVGYDWNYNPALSQQKGWYSLLNLRWAIFNGNAKRYRLKSEKVKLNIYENQADEVKLFLMKEINNRIINLQETQNQISLTNRLMKTTAENLEIAKAQYKAGTGSMIELADARTTDLSAKQKNIKAVAAFQIAVASLRKLVGNK